VFHCALNAEHIALISPSEAAVDSLITAISGIFPSSPQSRIAHGPFVGCPNPDSIETTHSQ
jgi:hypothetical protein